MGKIFTLLATTTQAIKSTKTNESDSSYHISFQYIPEVIPHRNYLIIGIHRENAWSLPPMIVNKLNKNLK